MAKKINAKRVLRNKGNKGHNGDLDYVGYTAPTVGKLDELVGFELVEATCTHMTVAKDGRTYKIEFDEDGGDCCGCASITSTLVCKDGMNPVITRVEYNRQNDGGEFDSVQITFFGMSKALAVIDSESSSGSGWCYGACASVSCKALGLDEIITSW